MRLLIALGSLILDPTAPSEPEIPGLRVCMEQSLAAWEDLELLRLRTEVSRACQELYKPAEPQLMCCPQNNQTNVLADTCGAYQPRTHDICVYYNKYSPQCSDPKRGVRKVLFEEYFHAYQSCLHRNPAPENTYRRLPVDLSHFRIPVPGQKETFFRCSQIDPGEALNWMLEINAKCHNPFGAMNSSRSDCESFCSQYAGAEWYRQGCCQKLCETQYTAICSWIDWPPEKIE